MAPTVWPQPIEPLVSMKKKVLIVEDEPLIGMMLAENVRDLGGQVSRIVTTGEAAMRAVEQERPDAILMDINIEGPLDGIETARAIMDGQAIPILFFTGHQDPELIERASSVGPVGIVDKLDSTEAIHQALSSLLR